MLYLCATPIGNMEDITLRTLRILSEADAIYAEDTRHSALLLNHYEIKKPLISCHEHNEAQRADEIASRIQQGENIAYISDAGMPCVSDPGSRLVKKCVDENLPFTVLPGATACVTALALSGLDSEHFTFYGFLQRTGKERKMGIEFIKNSSVSVIIYESPSRVHATLTDLQKHIGGSRYAALVREITKVYEEAVRGTIDELCERYKDTPPKGECVIIIEGKAKDVACATDIDTMINELMANDMRAKDIAKQVAETYGISKNDVYKRVLEMAGEGDE